MGEAAGAEAARGMTALSTPPAYWLVRFDDTGEERRVVRFCLRCYDRRSSPETVAEVSLVSPTGAAHVQHEDIPEKTACGLNATGYHWWWRL